MDVALLLDRLVPGAVYGGVPGETEAEYDALRWGDERAKPAWSVLLLAAAAAPDWSAVRSERNRLLAACDWTQVPDAPLADEPRAAWRAYRQALRDLPETAAAPDDVVWPTTPA